MTPRLEAKFTPAMDELWGRPNSEGGNYIKWLGEQVGGLRSCYAHEVEMRFVAGSPAVRVVFKRRPTPAPQLPPSALVVETEVREALGALAVQFAGGIELRWVGPS